MTIDFENVTNDTMDQYIKLAKLADIEENKPLCAEFEGRKLSVYKTAGKYYVSDNTCTHAGGPLCQGELENGVITCPWHNSKFEVATGKVVSGPADHPIKTYETRVSGEYLEISLT